MYPRYPTSNNDPDHSDYRESSPGDPDFLPGGPSYQPRASASFRRPATAASSAIQPDHSIQDDERNPIDTDSRIGGTKVVS